MIWLLTACAPPGPQPSLVLVTLDTTRADRISSYGYTGSRTPVIDGFAEHGIRFDQAFTTAPQTLPAHASILTGLYPPAHGVRVNGDRTVPEEVETLAERLGAQGYTTLASVAAFPTTETWNFDQGFDLFLDDLVPGDDRWANQRPAAAVMQDIQQRLKDVPTDKPLFLWIHLFDPHEPYQVQGVFEKRGQDGYDGEIAFADAQISRIQSVLERWSPDRPFAWIVVGDHGEGFGDPEKGHGTYLYPATTRVPMVVLPAEPLAEGVVVDTPVSVVDVVPTALGLLGLPAAEGLDGVNLAPALDGSPVERGPIYLEAETARVRWGWAPEVAVIDGPGIFFATPSGGWFDRLTDPLFTTDRSAEHAAEAQELAAFAQEVRSRQVSGPSLDLGGLAAQLASLGYVTGDADRPAREIDAKDHRDQVARMDEARRLARDPATVGQAEQIWRELLAASPDLLEPRQGLVALAESQGQLEAALVLLDEGLALDPGASAHPSKLHLDRGRVLMQLGRMPEAEAEARLLLAANPASRNARDLLVSTIPLAQALEQVRAWQKEAPEDLFLHAKAGQLLLVQGKVEEAEPELRLAAQAPLPWIGVHRALGVVEVSKGNLDGGWQEFSTELGLYPEDPAAWHALGEHLKRTNQLKPAFELYSKLLFRRPGDRRARASITEVLLKNGDLASADVAFAPLVPTEDPYEMIVWANLLQAKGDKAQGDAVFERAKAKMDAGRRP